MLRDFIEVQGTKLSLPGELSANVSTDPRECAEIYVYT